MISEIRQNFTMSDRANHEFFQVVVVVNVGFCNLIFFLFYRHDWHWLSALFSAEL